MEGRWVIGSLVLMPRQLTVTEVLFKPWFPVDTLGIEGLRVVLVPALLPVRLRLHHCEGRVITGSSRARGC